VFFVPLSDQLPPPPDFAGNIVVGKTYELTPGSTLENSLATMLMSANQPLMVQGNVFGDPRLVPDRLGQRAFKALVLTSYHRRCAITGAKIVPTLEAAHIKPVARGGENRLDNGLLLRSDIHTLYDRGYLGVDTNLRLRVSPRLRDDYANGDEFYARDGTEVISLPERRIDRPNREALTWHMDTLFKSA
jgi:putative restriction endonuclease